MTFAILIIAMSAKAQKTGSFTDSRDGKTYKTVKIGTQTWMAENLAYKADSGCWAYNNDQSNVKIYGYLYNWETAKKVCPEGWHLPSDAEWSTLTDSLGGADVAGGKLKSTTGWESPNEGATNSSGFTALPGGYLRDDGAFGWVENYGYWWCSTEDATNYLAWNRNIGYDFSSVNRKCYYYKNTGFSVRCIKDK